MLRGFALPVVISASIFLAGCAHRAPVRAAAERTCVQAPLDRVLPSALDAEEALWPEADKATVQARWSAATLTVAESLELGRWLARLTAAEREAARSDGRAQQASVRLRAAVHARVTLVLLELSTAAAHVDCEEERANLLASSLERQASLWERRLTLTAIGIGAATTVVASSLLLTGRDRGGEWVALGGGLGELGVGALALFREPRAVLRHEQNVLRLFIDGTASRVLPRNVTRLLELPRPEQPERSRREEILARWRQSAGPASTKVEPLLFGDGGTYDTDALRLRADLLDQLEAEIKLLAREVERLLREVLAGG